MNRKRNIFKPKNSISQRAKWARHWPWNKINTYNPQNRETLKESPNWCCGEKKLILGNGGLEGLSSPMFNGKHNAETAEKVDIKSTRCHQEIINLFGGRKRNYFFRSGIQMESGYLHQCLPKAIHLCFLGQQGKFQANKHFLQHFQTCLGTNVEHMYS